MADIKRQADDIHEEINQFQRTFFHTLKNIESAFVEFRVIEDLCTDMDLDRCLKEHDEIKLRRADVLRRRHRLESAFQKTCVTILPKIWNWKKELPIVSEADVNTASRFLECYQPYMQKFLESAKEEESLFDEGIRKLQPMVPPTARR